MSRLVWFAAGAATALAAVTGLGMWAALDLAEVERHR